MTIAGDGQQKIEGCIEGYLDRLRRDLRGLSQEEIREIVEELRSHILDKASANGEATAAGVDAALAALGRPEDLAREYVTDAVLALSLIHISTPLLPATMACQTASVVLPREQMRPMPVMTTRRSGWLVRLISEFLNLIDGRKE